MVMLRCWILQTWNKRLYMTTKKYYKYAVIDVWLLGIYLAFHFRSYTRHIWLESPGVVWRMALYIGSLKLDWCMSTDHLCAVLSLRFLDLCVIVQSANQWLSGTDRHLIWFWVWKRHQYYDLTYTITELCNNTSGLLHSV